MSVLPEFNLTGWRRAAYMDEFKDKKGTFPFEGIWLFAGAQGTGKTLCMMHVVRNLVDQFPDVKIVSDISIFGVPCIPFTGVKDFNRYNNGEKGIVFVIDEIQTIWNSLQSNKMPESNIAIWSQNRKNRRVILGTSQRFTRVAKPIREQTRYLIKCNRPLFHIYPYRLYDGDDFDDDGNYTGDKNPRLRFYVPKVDVMSMYNTLEVVKGDKFDNGNDS